VQPTATDPDQLRLEIRQLQERSSREQKETMDALTARLGRPLKDWAYSVCGNSEPDGVHRQTVIYFTRTEAPEVFAVRDQNALLWRQQREELRQFFAGLP
jgi:hypothetical protein